MALLLRKVTRALAITLAVLVGIVALAGVALLWVHPDELVRQRLLLLKPRLERQIGRTLSFGAIRLRIWPSLGFEVRDIAIAGQAPGDEPLLGLPYLEGSVALWPLLRSRGGEVRISDLRTQGLVLTVVRLPDGRLSCQDVLDRLRPRAPVTPLSPRQQARLEPVVLSHAELLGTALRFQDLGSGPGKARSVSIEQLDLRLWDVGVGRPFALTLDAAVAAPERNLHLEATVGPLPSDLDLDDPLGLLQRVQLRVQSLQVQLLAAWFLKGSAWLVPDQALVTADVLFERPSDTQRLRLLGSAEIRGLVLQKGGRRGQPADVLVRSDLEATEDAGSVLVRHLELSVNDMSIRGSADLRDLWTRPAVPEFSLSSQGMDLERLAALLPPGLLPGVVLRGPVSLYASKDANAAQPLLQAGIDLSAATILSPQLHKPAQMPGTIEFRGQVRKDGIRVERLGVVLGPASLWLHGRVRSPRDVDLSLDSGSVALERLLRLSPQVARTVRAGTVLRGAAQIVGGLKRQGDVTSASAHLFIRGARARLSGLALSGTTEMHATGRFSPQAASATVDLDLSAAGLVVQKVIDKNIGVPMRLRLAAERHGQRLTLKEARLDLPGAMVEARGHADLDRPFLDVRVPRFRADLTRIERVLPALRDRQVPAGELETALRLDGDPSSLRTLRLRIEDLSFVGAGGHLTGRAEALGLDRPERVAFDVSGAGLDLGELLGWMRGLKKPGREAVIDELRALEVDGRMHLERVRIRGVAVQRLALAVSLAHGKAEIHTLQAAAFGGTVTADGSTADLSQSPPPLFLHAKLDEIRLEQFLALFGPQAEHKAKGRVSIEARLTSSGLTWSRIWPQIRGPAGFTFTDGLIRDVAVHAKLMNPSLKGLIKHSEITMHRDEIALRAATGRVQVGGQRLHLTGPLRVSNNEMIMQLSGDIGFDGTLNLVGGMEILPEGFSVATKGRLVLSGAVPVTMHIGGDGKLPQVTLDKLDDTVSEMVGGLLGEDRQPAIQPPQPVQHQPGQDRASTGIAPTAVATIKQRLPNKAGKVMLNVKLGPSFSVKDTATQFALVLDIGLAVTRDRNGYLLLPLQFQVGQGLTAFLFPFGFQYDIPIPLRGFYLYPRLSAGYAVLIGADPGRTVVHQGLILPEFGIKYVPGRRFNFGFEPFSLPIYFDRAGARISYRLMFYGGVNL